MLLIILVQQNTSILLQIDVIRNSVFNGKTQLIEGYKQ